jgi:hypothetical protein
VTVEEAFAGLVASLRALTDALPAPPPRREPAQVILFPRRRARMARPRRQRERFRGYERWPVWGFEHLVTCRRAGCVVCARLEQTPYGVGHD